MHGSGDKKCFNSIGFHKFYPGMIKWIPIFPLHGLFTFLNLFPNVNESETAKKCLNPKTSMSHE